MTRMNVLVLSLVCILTMGGCKQLLTDQGKRNPPVLQIAASNQTPYVIVRPSAPTPVDDYAINTLTNFLFQKTGAVFPVVLPGQVSPANKHIFVGLSETVLEIAGKDPLAALKDQEYVTKNVGNDIFLYGKGLHGNLYAVLDFMETTLGRRWYTEWEFPENTAAFKRQEGQPVFTVERNLTVKPFDRKGGFSFTYRIPAALPYNTFFFLYQHGLNMGFSERRNVMKKLYGADPFPGGVVSLSYLSAICHTLFGYIPPTPDAHIQFCQHLKPVFDWVAKKDYFTSNPEYFGMRPDGKRDILLQLCFANSELRRELTKNILDHLRILKAEGQERLIIDVQAMDFGSEFCFCPGCQALKQKYGSLGGPIYDYLFELCALVKKQHPDVMIHTLAYRLSQTQKPPVMPTGQAFPDNLIVQFADVEDNPDADWNSPISRPSYDDLLAWGKLTPLLWTWYYPNTLALRSRMPNGNIERLVTDLRLMKKAGVEGVFYEFSTFDVIIGNNFTELQKYVYVKLLKDIDCDVAALIREFTDYQYGPAAPLTRTYLQELEAAQKTASQDTSPSAGKGIIHRVMTGLTPAILRRWQGYFDRMENDTAPDPRLHQNVRRLRHTLDYATLAHWNDLTKAYPDYFTDYLVIKKRLGAIPGCDKAAVEDWEMLIKTAGIEKPLPAPFDGMDKTRIRRFVPVCSQGAPTMIMDPDAAFGYGAVVHLPDKPFTFGFYQNDTRTHGPKCALESGDTQPGGYRLYKLGEVTVTPNCIVWFSSLSWATSLQLGERLYNPPAPDNDNRYDVHVSLKFGPPIPPATNAPYSVLCDQIIVVKKPVKQ